MAAATLTSLAPLTLGSTTLATANLRVSPDVATIMHRNSGNEFPSVVAVPGAAPRISFSTPFYEAYNLIGLKGTPFSTANVYLAKFASGIRSASSVHVKYALTASCSVFAYIKSLAGSQGGIIMAEVELVYLSNDGTTYPFTPSTSNALPSLASQPALRTIGPATLNGTTTAGISSINVDLAPAIETMVNDGDLYPRTCAYEGGTPVITCEHMDPDALRAAIGLTGSAISSNAIIYLRDYDTTSQLASTTGVSLTVASGRIVPVEWGADNLQVAKGGFRVDCLSTPTTPTTHPIVVATGASVPTP